ncbi:MAG TPA: 2-dehydropantoate 2-reductase [Bacteroidetes bacterium]|nr:2-dehydropantoate 2-reductase [Bacteroidota bacterium]
MIMRFVVMGAGGIGGFFGGALARAGEDVWFVGRGKHFDAMQREGLRITSTAGNFTVPSSQIVQDPALIGPADVILFCVKSYDTESAARQLSPLLSERSLIISLQNGVDNVEKIAAILPHCSTYGGAAYISSRITAPGLISETGGFQRIVFGPMSGEAGTRAGETLNCLTRAGIKSQLSANIRKDLWQKLIFIASMGSLTALSRLTHGEIIGNPGTRALMFDAMREVQSVALKLGIDVDPVDESRVLEGLKRFRDDTRSSMYYDLIAEKPLEVEALNGTVVRLGERVGVPTPIHRVIYAILLSYHLRHTAASSPRPADS